MTRSSCLAALALSISASSLAADAPLSTVAERSGWVKTGRYEEVVRLCRDFERAYPGRARCVEFGTTPEARPMMALVVSADGVLDPEAARRKGRPAILIQGGIHAGEIDGKDAGFLALRGLLGERGASARLSRVTVVFVPVLNADGHERFGPASRPNQKGPEEMGWRTTGQNLNLNRDYAKAEAPEMASMLGLLGKWDPIVYADLHVTDGAQYQHDVAVMVSPSVAGPERLCATGRGLQRRLLAALEARGHMPLPVYPSFVREDEPASGLEVFAGPPRLSHYYWGARNRFGILVETHSWKDYAVRVRAAHDLIIALIEAASDEGRSWVEAAEAQDAADRELSGAEQALTFERTDKSREFEFQGYAYDRTTSTLSGGLRTVYDTSRPLTLKVPLYYELKPKLLARPPRGGYIIPAAHAGWLAVKLRMHGIAFEPVREERPAAAVEAFRAVEADFAKGSEEGRLRLAVKGRWAPERRDIAAGSLFVPIRQPRSRLILQLLEPEAPDSFLSWGFFNSAFERKEYMEPYVAEQIGAEMMARSPEVKSAFEERLAEDPGFARDPEKRLDFFYRRHPSFDERLDLYPVLRVGDKP